MTTRTEHLVALPQLISTTVPPEKSASSCGGNRAELICSSLMRAGRAAHSCVLGRIASLVFRLPAEVIPVREAVYRKRAKIAGTLTYEVEIEGIAVYERA